MSDEIIQYTEQWVLDNVKPGMIVAAKDWEYLNGKQTEYVILGTIIHTWKTYSKEDTRYYDRIQDKKLCCIEWADGMVEYHELEQVANFLDRVQTIRNKNERTL